MNVYDCKIISKEYISKGQFFLEIESPEIARECKAGQFVNIQCDSLLRRPISISGVNREKSTFTIGIRVKGSGTAYLNELTVGDVISVLGPLGTAFDFSDTETVVAVGGGIGVFPLMFLLHEAKLNNKKTITVCGFRSKDDSFCLDKLEALSDEVIFASECGDLHVCGNAVDALKTISLDGCKIFTCGPTPMMKYVSELAQTKNVPCQVSLEERMGCGTGICLVCACKIKAEAENDTDDSNKITVSENDFEYKRCCKDGPVFDSKEVVWE
jgi:dihydroorotate dehydrogenase electron transfer subunit